MSEKDILNVFCLSDEEVEEKGDCKICGGKGEICIESGAGDNFTQSYVRCECKGTDEDNYIDMSGAGEGDR